MGYEGFSETPPEVDDSYTVANIRFLAERFGEPDENGRYGYIDKRPLIGRDAPINGGAYYTIPRAEIVIIDDKEFPEKLDSVYVSLLKAIMARQANGENYRDGLLEDIGAVVRERMPYDNEYVEEVERSCAGKKVSLHEYVDRGGICRHQTLLAGYLVERLIGDGLLDGQVSVDRNQMRWVIDGKSEKGGHAWARYKDAEGVVHIVDEAQGYIGRLDDAGPLRWEYRRPEERE